MASVRCVAPRHGEDERIVVSVVRGVILARQRDGDLGPLHLDLPNVGSNQFDGRIVSGVPADRILCRGYAGD
jgi:hypothetical protein